MYTFSVVGGLIYMNVSYSILQITFLIQHFIDWTVTWYFIEYMYHNVFISLLMDICFELFQIFTVTKVYPSMSVFVHICKNVFKIYAGSYSIGICQNIPIHPC